MFNLKILRLSSIVLISLSSCLCALAPASIQVLSPSEFDVILAPDENGTLLDVQININREFDSGTPDYRKQNVTGRVIHFFERSLILRRGDIIYYSLTFDDGERGLRGEDGNYIFDGVYKRRDIRGREVYEQNSEETFEGKNVNQDPESEESRYLRHGPRGHPNHYGPHHRHPFGPHNFFPPPFGAPHHPPPYPGPVYNRQDIRGRELNEQNSEETFEGKNENQDPESEESRYLRHGPRGHPSHHGPHDRHPFGPNHFFPPPFGAPHHPPPYPGPVYNRRDIRGREVNEQNSEETFEGKNENQDPESEESRYLRHGPRGHPSHHGPHHRHHFGPPHFFPPPFGAPHHPPPYPGPVYNSRGIRGRDVYQENSEETFEGKNVNQDPESEESRYLRYGPRGHPSHHRPHHRHHFGPHHFFPPPFGGPHHPPSYPGPDSWREHGYEHRDNFGHHGPWEDHDSDSFGHKPKYPGGEQRPDNSKPWRGGPEDDPYPDSNGNNGVDRPSDGKPNKGTGSGNNNPNESDDSSKNNNNTTTENSIVEVFTTRTTTTTARTTTVPDIDMRFRLPDDPDSNGNNGFDRPSGGKPNKATGSESDISNEIDDSSNNDNNTTTENAFVEVV